MTDRDLMRFGRAAAYLISPEATRGQPPREVFRFGRHPFRRLNISWRQEAGATPFEVMKAAGHAKPDTTWAYTINDEKRERQHVSRIWERIGGSLAMGAIN